MARFALWTITFGCVITIFTTDTDKALFPAAVAFISVCVSAICESIEKGK